MNSLKYLLSRHAGLLSTAQLTAVNKRIACVNENLYFAAPVELNPFDTQAAWLHVEREFSADPIWLFGQQAPSLAHSRIRLLRKSPETGLPEEIFSARISEKALTEAILSANVGEGSPVTITRLGNQDIAPRGRPDGAAHRDRLAADLDARSKPDENLAAISGLLAAGLRKSNIELREHIASLARNCDRMADVQFSLDRHLENMVKYRSEIVTEAAHAALHSEKVVAAMSGQTAAPRLIADEDGSGPSHPMADMMGFMPSEDFLCAVQRMFLAEINALEKEHPGVAAWVSLKDGNPHVTIPSERGIAVGLGYSVDPALESRMAGLHSLCNSLFNPHVCAAREKVKVDQACLSVSRIQGWTGGIHSSLPASEGTYFLVRVTPAIEEISFGTSKVRAIGAPIVEVNMIADDLMMALRGHPQGEPIPCSLRTLSGVSLAAVAQPKHQITSGIEHMASRAAVLPQVVELEAAVKSLTGLVESTRSGAAWALGVADQLQDVYLKLGDARKAVAALLHEGRMDIEDEMIANAREALASIASAVPPGVIELLIGRPIEGAEIGAVVDTPDGP